MRILDLAVFTVALGSLVGCATFSAPEYLSARHNELLMQGNSVSYSDGYIDGCATGKASASDRRFRFSKNSVRFEGEKDYKNGWTQGRQFCQEETLSKRSYDAQRAKQQYYEEKRRDISERRHGGQTVWDDMRK